MPVHDWTRVDAGIFHDFHLSWIGELKRAFNNGALPQGYYALAKQVAAGREPDVLTLKSPETGQPPNDRPAGGVALAESPPQVQFRVRAESDIYAAKARALTIRHVSNHQVVAMLEIISPGNKSSRHALRAFVEKAVDMLRAGIHLVIVDLFPPGPRDPEGFTRRSGIRSPTMTSRCLPTVG